MESIIMNKIRVIIFTEELVTSTFHKHIGPLKQHMVVVLAMAEALLKCSEDIVISVARDFQLSLQQAGCLLPAGGGGVPGG